MTAIPILILVLSALCLTSLALGVFSIWHVRAIAGSVDARLETTREESDSHTESLREQLDALAGQLREMERQPAITLAPGLPKPGMNVMKRSQALRMHRRGDRPDQIAATLELPRQEVELLLKVHSIVVSNV